MDKIIDEFEYKISQKPEMTIEEAVTFIEKYPVNINSFVVYGNQLESFIVEAVDGQTSQYSLGLMLSLLNEKYQQQYEIHHDNLSNINELMKKISSLVFAHVDSVAWIFLFRLLTTTTTTILTHPDSKQSFERWMNTSVQIIAKVFKNNHFSLSYSCALETLNHLLLFKHLTTISNETIIIKLVKISILLLLAHHTSPSSPSNLQDIRATIIHEKLKYFDSRGIQVAMGILLRKDMFEVVLTYPNLLRTLLSKASEISTTYPSSIKSRMLSISFLCLFEVRVLLMDGMEFGVDEVIDYHMWRCGMKNTFDVDKVRLKTWPDFFETFCRIQRIAK